MRPARSINRVIAGAAFSSLVLAPAVAQQRHDHRHHYHSHATGVVKERMEAMEAMANRIKAINQRLKANRELEAIKVDAEAIRQLAIKVPAMFPPDSTSHPSEAKAAIWQKWPDFEAKARALVEQSGKLEATDSRDAKAMIAQTRTVSRTCGACHELYRAKR